MHRRQEAEGSRRLAQALAHGARRCCWVAECGYDIVGVMCIVTRAGVKKPHWLIESIDIDEAHQGRGLTRMLLDAVRAEARLQRVRGLATLCSPKGRGDGDCLLRGQLY